MTSATEGEGPELPATGDPDVDRIIAPLADAAARPLRDQVELYERVHGELQDFMADQEA